MFIVMWLNRIRTPAECYVLDSLICKQEDQHSTPVGAPHPDDSLL